MGTVRIVRRIVRVVPLWGVLAVRVGFGSIRGYATVPVRVERWEATIAIGTVCLIPVSITTARQAEVVSPASRPTSWSPMLQATPPAPSTVPVVLSCRRGRACPARPTVSPASRRPRAKSVTTILSSTRAHAAIYVRWGLSQCNRAARPATSPSACNVPVLLTARPAISPRAHL
jgi:hypothetical protein